MTKKQLTAVGYDRALCPACGNSHNIRSHNPERSGMWQHYFGRKCKQFRTTRGGTFPDGVVLALLIKQADNLGQKKYKAAIAKQKADAKAAADAHKAMLVRKYTISGAFLLDVIAEMEGLINMMEPYYSQCAADSDARETIRKIESILDENK